MIEKTAYPKTPGGPESYCLRSSIVGAGVCLEVVVDIEIVEVTLSSLVVVLLHFREEPGQEVDVVVSGVISVTDGAGPVYIVL